MLYFLVTILRGYYTSIPLNNNSTPTTIKIIMHDFFFKLLYKYNNIIKILENVIIDYEKVIINVITEV